MSTPPKTANRLVETTLRLLEYCRANQWQGHDPFDGLNSRLFSRWPLLDHRLVRLIFLQGMKRSPINLRRLLQIPTEPNAKGMALFCSALIKLANLAWIQDDRLIQELLTQLKNLASPGRPTYCWGYPFDWQNRSFFLPKNEPNIVATSFAGHAFLDAFERYGQHTDLDIAISAGRFILQGLNLTHEPDGVCFSYTPYDHDQIHNASLLGAALLARLYAQSGEKEFKDFSLNAARFSIRRQNEDGSWFYGEKPSQRWIDHFHTGYNLCALQAIGQWIGTAEFTSPLHLGFDFYRQRLFSQEGLVKYFHNRLYPIDVHCVAQGIITLLTLRTLAPHASDQALSIYRWAVDHLWDQQGYFYYQIHRWYKNRIPYMRWSQAWMLFALAQLMEQQGPEEMERGVKTL